MTPEQIEQNRERVRVNLLRQMDRVHPLSLTVAHLHEGLVIEGLATFIEDVRSELEALEEAGLVKSAGDPLNNAILRYKRTEAGRVALVNRGFVAR